MRVRSIVLFDLLLLTFSWLVAIVVVNPSGNFPLNDDWSYAIAVQRMLETGDFRPLGWTSSALISQTIWGTAFCKVFGYSFEVLRGATLTVSLLGIFAIYILALQLKLNRKKRLFLSLCIAFNPLWFALSFTFMTDVYFVTFTAITLLFFIRFLQEKKWIDWTFGIVFSLVAILCRQFGLFIPMAFCVIFLFVNLKTFTNKKITIYTILQAILPLFIGLAVLFFFQNWMKNTGRTPFAYGAQTGRLWSLLQNPMELPTRFFKNTFIAFVYLGWFLLPLLAKRWTRTNSRRWVILLSAVVFSGLLYFNKLMPLGKNIIQKTGIGPLSLYDTMMLDLPGIESIYSWLWLLITGLGVTGGSLLFYLITSILLKILTRIWNRNLEREDAIVLFLLLGTFIYFLPIALHGFFDRYLLPLLFLLPLAIFVFYDKNNTKIIRNSSENIAYLGMYISALLFTVMFIFSITTTHDYLSLNRTRWEAVRDLNEFENIPFSDIDGGLEFNGLYFYDAEYQTQDTTGIWWWTGKRDYVFSFSELPDFEAIKRYKYERWMPPHNAEIWILKRK